MREDIYALVENLRPSGDLVDGSTVVVSANKLAMAAGVPRWRKFAVTHAQFQASLYTNDFELVSLEPGGIVHAVKVKHSTAFAGSGFSAYTLSVGFGDRLDGLFGAFDVMAAPSVTNFGVRWMPHHAFTSLPGDGVIGALALALTAVAPDASTVDGTYGAEEQAVIGSLRTQFNALLGNLGPLVTLRDDTETLRDAIAALMSPVETGTRNHAAAQSVRVRAVATGSHLDQSIAGAAEIWLLTSVAT